MVPWTQGHRGAMAPTFQVCITGWMAVVPYMETVSEDRRGGEGGGVCFSSDLLHLTCPEQGQLLGGWTPVINRMSYLV